MPITLNVMAFDIPNTLTYQIEAPGPISVQTLLELVYDQQHGLKLPFSFALQFFGTPPPPPVPVPPPLGIGLGYMVVMLNGRAEDDKAGTYWHLLVADTDAPLGIDEEFVQDGDIIGFQYGPYVAEQHGSTGYNAAKAKARATAPY